MMGINTPDVSVWEAVLQLDDDYLAPVGKIKKKFYSGNNWLMSTYLN